jgi:hypothetical protein
MSIFLFLYVQYITFGLTSVTGMFDETILSLYLECKK